jgi:hypothetical protein
MSLRLQIIYISVGLLFFLIIMYFIRSRKLNPSYTFLWFILAIFLMSIPILQDFYIYISHKFFGFYAENLIYLILIGFLIIYVLFLTSKVSKLNDQVKELISFTAILEENLKRKN